MKLKNKCLQIKQKQQGVVLVIALILIVVIAVAAIASIRTSGVDELVSSNTRSYILATQAADGAILYCKERVFTNPVQITVLKSNGADDEGVQWRDINNWTDASKINNVDAQGTLGAAQCMVEEITEFMANNATYTEIRPVSAFRITARGYSPNYHEENGVGVNGAQVWQQAIITRTAK